MPWKLAKAKHPGSCRFSRVGAKPPPAAAASSQQKVLISRITSRLCRTGDPLSVDLHVRGGGGARLERGTSAVLYNVPIRKRIPLCVRCTMNTGIAPGVTPSLTFNRSNNGKHKVQLIYKKRKLKYMCNAMDIEWRFQGCFCEGETVQIYATFGLD